MFARTETDVSKSDAGLRHSPRQAPGRRPTTVLVVDTHFLIREALRDALGKMAGDVAVIEATDGRQAMQLVSEHSQIDLALLELDLPDRDGLSLLGELRQHYPAIKVVMLSARHDGDSVTKSLALGAAGFIPKSGQREVMLSALELVLAGGVYIPPEILVREEAAPRRLTITRLRIGARAMTPADLGLSGRQTDVLQLMMRGMSNKAICRVLNLAEPTVKNHVTAIFKALKVSNRTEAVIAVGELSLAWPTRGQNGIPRVA